MVDDFRVWGVYISLYNVCNAVGFIMLVIYNFFQKGNCFIGLEKCQDDDLMKKKEVTNNPIMLLLLSAVQFFSGAVMNKVIGKLYNSGAYNYFGFAIFAPIIFYCFCKLVKKDGIGYLDAFSPAYALSLACFKLGCFCAGCCGGAQIKPVLYYPRKSNYQFPIQLVECAVAVGIFVFLVFYKKKARRGTMHPMFLFLYSATRFFTEFLRREENLFWYFKEYHLWCLLGICWSLAEFLWVKKTRKGESTA